MNELTPREIVAELDRYIVGQDKAKRAVAIALRNRYRRQQLPEEIRDEVCYYIRVFGNLSGPKRANLDEGCGTHRKAA